MMMINERENFENISHSSGMYSPSDMMMMNSDGKKFICGYNGCFRSYTTAGNLKTHVKIHRGIHLLY